MAGSGSAHLRPADDVLLQVNDLVVEFHAGRNRTIKAVSGISFDVARGETLGLVGESGCGKSTTGKAILQIPRPTGGSVILDGEDLVALNSEAMRAKRTSLQMIFQDPISSLNPRRMVGEVVAEPLNVWGPKDKDEQWNIVARILDQVGIDPGPARYKRPHEFSGGQCQRISIARALVTGPELIICDEPVSALDVSVRAQVVNLLQDLQQELGLTYLFIAHDLSVVRHISHRIAILYAGRLVEIAPTDDVYVRPLHPYTEALLSSVPIPDPPLQRARKRIVLTGEIPNPVNPPPGCRFQSRCPLVHERCRVESPPLEEKLPGHWAACHAR